MANPQTEVDRATHDLPFLLTRNASNESDPIYEFLSQLCALQERNPDAIVRVENHSGPINYSYTGHLPKPSYTNHRGYVSPPATQEATNEYYTKDFLKALARIKGVRRYIGVVGGADQHIQLLAALQKGNKLDTITLYDIEPAQMFVAGIAFGSYNRAIREGKLEEFTIGESWVSADAPRLSGQTDIELKHGDIGSAFPKLTPSTYFIYLSNMLQIPVYDEHYKAYGAFGGRSWLGFEKSREMLLEVQNNPSILDGSCILLSTVLPKLESGQAFFGNIILKKERGKLVVHTIQHPDFNADKLNEYLATLNDRAKFVSWFAGKSIEGTVHPLDSYRNTALFDEVNSLSALRKS